MAMDLAAVCLRAFDLAVWRMQVERAMRPLSVVVVDEDPEHPLGLAVMPRMGSVNPMLVGLSLARRLADHLAQ